MAVHMLVVEAHRWRMSGATLFMMVIADHGLPELSSLQISTQMSSSNRVGLRIVSTAW